MPMSWTAAKTATTTTAPTMIRRSRSSVRLLPPLAGLRAWTPAPLAASCRAFIVVSTLWTPMNTSISAPMTMLVHHELSSPLNWMRLWMSAVISTPNRPPTR